MACWRRSICRHVALSTQYYVKLNCPPSLPLCLSLSRFLCSVFGRSNRVATASVDSCICWRSHTGIFCCHDRENNKKKNSQSRCVGLYSVIHPVIFSSFLLFFSLDDIHSCRCPTVHWLRFEVLACTGHVSR